MRFIRTRVNFFMIDSLCITELVRRAEPYTHKWHYLSFFSPCSQTDDLASSSGKRSCIFFGPTPYKLASSILSEKGLTTNLVESAFGD